MQRRTPITSPDGGTQIKTVTTTRTKGMQRQSRSTERRTPIPSGGSQVETTTSKSGTRPNLRKYSPTRAGERAGSVGLLEIEFLGCLGLLVLLLFADLNKSYPDKVMSTMKRGTMICVLFFILALVSGIGRNTARIAEAIGGTVFLAILLTSPVTDVIGNFDKFLRQDWVGTAERGSDVGSTSNVSEGGAGTSGTTGPLQASQGAISRITQIIESLGFGIIK